jgi:hypothetical protein
MAYVRNGATLPINTFIIIIVTATNVRFHNGVKSPCAAIRASKHRGMESKKGWICSWGIYLHTVCLRIHKESRMVAGGL